MSIKKIHPALRRVKETILKIQSVPATFFKQEFTSPTLREKMGRRAQKAALQSEQPAEDSSHNHVDSISSP